MFAVKRLMIILALVLTACSGAGTDEVTPSSTVDSTTTAPPPARTSPPPTLSGSPNIGSPSTKDNPEPALCDRKVSGDNPPVRRVRFGAHPNLDRLAFDFCTPNRPVEITARQVDSLRQDPSDKAVIIPGTVFYVVRLEYASAETMSYQPVRVNGGNVVSYVFLGSFEGVVTVGVGARKTSETITGKSEAGTIATRYVDFGVAP